MPNSDVSCKNKSKHTTLFISSIILWISFEKTDLPIGSDPTTNSKSVFSELTFFVKSLRFFTLSKLLIAPKVLPLENAFIIFELEFSTKYDTNLSKFSSS